VSPAGLDGVSAVAGNTNSVTLTGGTIVGGAVTDSQSEVAGGRILGDFDAT
jgi:hypothetical protein